MKKKLIVISILVSISLGCNLIVSDLFGSSNGSGNEEFYDEVEYSRSLTATLYAVETLIAEATATAEAAEDENNGFSEEENSDQESGGDDQFCTIYSEFVDDLNARVDHYEEVVSEKGDAHPIAVEADQAIEIYMDRLVPYAPFEIQLQVEMLANMSLIGFFSSNEGVPEAETLLKNIDVYAAETCGETLY